MLFAETTKPRGAGGSCKGCDGGGEGARPMCHRNPPPRAAFTSGCEERDAFGQWRRARHSEDEWALTGTRALNTWPAHHNAKRIAVARPSTLTKVVHGGASPDDGVRAPGGGFRRWRDSPLGGSSLLLFLHVGTRVLQHRSYAPRPRPGRRRLPATTSPVHARGAVAPVRRSSVRVELHLPLRRVPIRSSGRVWPRAPYVADPRVGGRGSHSCRFQLNLSSSVHRVTHVDL
jgi:hypothetical protein